VLPLVIVEYIDVIEDIFSREIAGFVGAFLNAFLFWVAEELISVGIIPTFFALALIFPPD